jgi:1,4-dihydroxy-2-naphthoate octaprenyltransferase
MTELDVVAPGPSAVLVRPGSLRAWVLACRPPTLVASFVPVAVGTACARASGGFRLGPALAALVGAALLQIGCNFANDVFDHEKGADTAERLGPMRAVSAGLLSAAAVRRGMLVVFALSVAIGVYLTAIAGPIIMAIGLFSILSAIAYTGGPYPLGYHGLGDVFVLVFFGFVAVCGTAFVQMGRVPELAIWSAVPVGALATAILVVNNLRDAETDARAGKRTLAVRFGERGAVAEYWALLVMSYAVPVLLVARGALGLRGLLPLVALPLAIKLGRGVARQRGRALNALLVLTAKHLLAFGLLFTAGILANTGA